MIKKKKPRKSLIYRTFLEGARPDSVSVREIQEFLRDIKEEQHQIAKKLIKL